MLVERCPNLQEEVGGLTPGWEISSLLDEKLARWSTTSSALALACRPSVSGKRLSTLYIFDRCRSGWALAEHCRPNVDFTSFCTNTFLVHVHCVNFCVDNKMKNSIYYQHGMYIVLLLLFSSVAQAMCFEIEFVFKSNWTYFATSKLFCLPQFYGRTYQYTFNISQYWNLVKK